MVTIKIKRKKYNPDYQHKEGGDNLVDLPPELAYLAEYNFKAYRYGTSVFLQGPGYDMKVIDEILKKINNQESVVIAITGPPGTGKTYLGMALAQILDSKFHCTDTPTPDPKEDDGQIPFTREHLMYLTGEDSPLVRGQVVLPDETHFGIGARGWQKRDQQDLTNYIAAIRSKGYILIMIVLHTQMIDKMVRDFVINYEIRVTNRGEGIVYRRWFPPFGKEVFKKRMGKIKLPLPDHELCNKRSCLGCSYLSPKKIKTRCMTIRAVYERRKEDFLNTQSKADEEVETKSKYLPFDEIIKGITDRGVKIVYKKTGEIHMSRTISNFRKAGYEIRTREEPDFIEYITGAMNTNSTEKTP